MAFVDFRKAFDTVSTEKLWKMLYRNGLKRQLRTHCKVYNYTALSTLGVRAGSEFSAVLFMPSWFEAGRSLFAGSFSVVYP